jgi:protease I
LGDRRPWETADRSSLKAGKSFTTQRTEYLDFRPTTWRYSADDWARMNQFTFSQPIAILATDGFEQPELQGPLEGLRQAGAAVKIVSTKPGKIQGMHHAEKGDCFDVDLSLEDARVSDFSALVIPGGLLNPDQLRSTPEAVEFVRQFAEADKPIAAICHAAWVLIEAGLANGRRLTSYHTIQTDVRNAGGQWVDEPVVVDNGIITSRQPSDVPAFTEAIIAAVGRPELSAVH